jgi:UDP-N-acetylglucosamine:LPS N-acetylglucosamine transferase
MGHVARCIPLIDEFLKGNNTVFVAGDSSQLSIIRQYFPEIVAIEHHGYPFDFGQKGSFRWGLVKQLPSLMHRWKMERQEVEHLCKDHQIDLVISDHRYGFYSETVHSIFLSHQVQLPLHWYEGGLQGLHRHWIQKFNEVWVVDDEQQNFAGKLSKSDAKLSISYIGILSRFQLYPSVEKRNGGTVIVVSGPSPFAEMFAREQEKNYANEEVIMILPNELSELKWAPTIKLVPSNDWRYCDQLLMNASKIVSRSGYSTLMDLIHLKVPFSITPTPGQSEQEYLFKYWAQRMKQ